MRLLSLKLLGYKAIRKACFPVLYVIRGLRLGDVLAFQAMKVGSIPAVRSIRSRLSGFKTLTTGQRGLITALGFRGCKKP